MSYKKVYARASHDLLNSVNDPILHEISIFARRIGGDIIARILSYSDMKMKIYLQNYHTKILFENVMFDVTKIHLIRDKYKKYVLKLQLLDPKLMSCALMKLFPNRNTDYSMVNTLLRKFPNLTVLHCSRFPEITGRTMKTLTRLVELDCMGCDKMTDDVFACLGDIEKLRCDHCPLITDKSLFHLPKLVKLSCQNTSITDNGIREKTQLSELYCSGCKYITDAGISCLPELTELMCIGCPISDAGLVTLPKLSFIVCRNCPDITEEMVETITLRQTYKTFGL